MGVIQFFVLLLTLFCLFITPIKADVQRVNSPFYGEVLFNFNQQKFFSAIIQLEKGLSQGTLAVDALEAKALLGSLYLGYGLQRNAEQIFNRVLETAVDKQSRDRAWFYLAKIQFQRGYYQLAYDHLEKITLPLPGKLEDERLTLTALSLMKINKVEQAIEFLEKQIKGNKNSVYARSNLAISLLKQGDQALAITLLNKVAAVPRQDAESAALIDRVNLLLANLHLKNQQFELASQYFGQIELHGRFSNPALLGLGWSAFGINEFAIANTAWSELADREPIDVNILEAYLAKPYLLYQTGNYSDSLAEYKKAIDVYHQQLNSIDQQLEITDFSELILAMVELDSDDEIGWYWQHDVLEGVLQSPYILEFISSHKFQESLKNYRDLLFIKKNLGKWLTSIHVFDDIVDVKVSANSELKPRAMDRLKQLSEQNHSKAIQVFSARISVIEMDEDALALADSTELKNLHQFRRVNERITYSLENFEGKLKPAELLGRMADLQHKNRLLAGLLKWDLMTRYKIRLRNIKNNLSELEKKNSHADQYKRNIKEIIKSLPQNYDGHRQRLATVAQQLKTAADQVDSLLQQYDAYLHSMLVDELVVVKEKIEIYRSQALLSVAHIYDINLKIDEDGQ